MHNRGQGLECPMTVPNLWLGILTTHWVTQLHVGPWFKHSHGGWRGWSSPMLAILHVLQSLGKCTMCTVELFKHCYNLCVCACVCVCVCVCLWYCLLLYLCKCVCNVLFLRFIFLAFVSTVIYVFILFHYVGYEQCV